MGIVDSKTFQNGNSVAVDLPGDIAFAAGTPVRIERNGDVVTIKPIISVDPAEERRKVIELVAALRSLEPVGEIEPREPYDFLERPGM